MIFARILVLILSLPLFAIHETKTLLTTTLEIEDPDMVFDLHSDQAREKIPFKSIYLTSSSFLLEAFNEAASFAPKDQEGKNKELPLVQLEIKSIEPFKQALECLQTNDISRFNYLYLPHLIEYAHKFHIDKLGEVLKNYVLTTNFSDLDDVEDLKWLRALAIEVAKVPFVPSKVQADKSWGQVLQDELIKYVLYDERIGNFRDLKSLFMQAIHRDMLFYKRLEGSDPDLVEEYVSLIDKRKTTLDNKIIEAKKREANRWAQEAAAKVSKAYLKLVKNEKRHKPIEIVIEAKDSTYKLEALKRVLPRYKVEIFPVGTYSLPKDLPELDSYEWRGFFVWPRFYKDCDCCNGFGAAILGASAGISTWLCGQALQIATCGYCCCFCSDCNSSRNIGNLWVRAWLDDRTACAFFYGPYEFFTSLRNLPNGRFCPTRVIKIVHKRTDVQ